jgi:hypothetical protein
VRDSRSQGREFDTKVWALRIALIAALAVLVAASSGIAALAFAITWGPNGVFLWLFMRGSLSLPRMLEPVHAIEPVVYRWLGVGLVKRIVATRLWPALNGFDVPPTAGSRQDFLNRTEIAARGAEVCHAATFALASLAALIFLAVGNATLAVWIIVGNIVLNGYPVMLQRCHRWRMQCIRGHTSCKCRLT